MKIVSIFESLPLIRKTGLRVLETFSCMKKEELLRCAKKISYPAILKIQTKEIAEKKEKGLVIILQNEVEFISQVSTIKEIMKKKFAKVKKYSLVIQKKGEGEQAIFSMKRHNSFGPVLEIYYKNAIMHSIFPLSDEDCLTLVAFLESEKQSEKISSFLKSCEQISFDKTIISFSFSTFVSSMEIFQGEVAVD